jgi:hypothetical protein
MINSNTAIKLKSILALKAKHSQYQKLPKIAEQYNIAQDYGPNYINRYEEERLNAICQAIDFSKVKTVLDIGGNTGYFSFELATRHPELGSLVVEGNREHADFIGLLAEASGLSVKSVNRYFEFNSTTSNFFPVDVTLLFNVIHHLGDDFGDKNLTVEDAKLRMLDCVNYLSDKTSMLVLQFGYCWKGIRAHGLFEHGTKKEMIDFIKSGTEGYWDIVDIYVAERDSESKNIQYNKLNDKNIERDDSMGEFGNRPIFILRSK